MPRVSFVVPCYNLAHFLPECVTSILSQSFADLEVVIMDDCSPDDTPEVARSFADPRVIYVRNEPNLRHLRNYNKGIGLARGEFVWLISADDSLRSRDVVARYVALMDAHPRVGYVFCSPIAIVDGAERGIVPWCYNGAEDFVVPGATFLERLLVRNRVAAPSGMARRACYDVSLFPLDLPHSGDWYLWCLYAMYFDVAYLAEPMVNYRLHEANMTNEYTGAAAVKGFLDEIHTVWRLREAAAAKGDPAMAAQCEQALRQRYVNMLLFHITHPGETGLTEAQFRQSVAEHEPDAANAGALRGAVWTRAADRSYASGDFANAATYYRLARVERPGDLRLGLKQLLLALGPIGRGVRALAGAGAAGERPAG